MKSCRFLKSISLFVALFSWFAAWGCIKPPFQAPDEFNHAIKAYSVGLSPLVTPEPIVPIAQRYLNPLLNKQVLSDMKFNRAVTLSDHDIGVLKNLVWRSEGKAEQFTSAFNYPYLYYLSIFSLGQGLSNLLSASPYESLYLYRLVSALLAALAWVLVYLSLPSELPCRRSVFLFLVLIPMLAFMSASINPDSILYPLTCLVIIGFYRLTFDREEKGGVGFASLALAGLTKATALVLFPAVGMVTGVVLCFRRNIRWGRTVLVGVAALMFVWFGFYAWAPRPDHIAYAGIPVHLNIWDYLCTNHYLFLLKSYWGILGWLDYALPDPWYLILYLLLGINAGLALGNWCHWVKIRFTWYALLFSVVFAAGMFGVEYLMLPSHGYVLQGRYFLPVSIGMAMFLVHRHAWARYIFLSYLAGFSLLFFQQTVVRYYDGDWGRAWRALPYTRPLDAPEPVEYLAVLPKESAPAARIAGFLDDVSLRGKELLLRGWSPVRDDAIGVRIRIVTPVMPEKVKGLCDLRPDVAQALGDPNYRKSGFNITLQFADEEQARTSRENLCVTVSTGEQGGRYLLSSANQECRSLLREGGKGI